MKGRQAGLAVQVLGYPKVRWAGKVLRFPTRKSLAILSYLAVHGQPTPRDELAELLWSRHAAGNLRPELYRLRSLPGASEWLEGGAIVAVLADTDLAAFEQAVREERYQEALALHPPAEVLLRGLEPGGAPAFGEWLEFERKRISALLRNAIRGRALELEERDALFEALDLVRHLLDLDPLDESAYRLAMRLEYKRGHIQAAQQYFETCRRTLKDELDLEPLAETLELAHEIERGSGLPDIHLRAPKRRIPAKLLRPPVLIGREREWAQMQAASEAGQAIFISGPAGVGKTRLMMDFARSKGTYVLLEGQPGDRAVPLSTLARMLTSVLPELEKTLPAWVSQELMVIVPELSPGEATAPVVGNKLRIHQAFDHLFRLVAGQLDAVPTDDLHHFDATSLEVCNHIMFQMLMETVRDKRPLRATSICAFRTDEMPGEFREGIEPLIASGLIAHIELAPLTAKSTQAMLETLKVDQTRASAPDLQRLTGGNPQLIIETLRGLYETGDLAHGRLERIALSESVSVIVHTRLSRLSETARRLVETLAVLKQEVNPERLAAIIGVNALDVAEGLSELETAQIFDKGAFLHDLFHEAILQSMPAQVRRLLHRRAAEVLSREGVEPARIAHHWQQAGEIEQAIEHWLEAARRYGAAGLHLGALDLLKQAAQHAQDAAPLQEAQLSLASTYLELGSHQEARNVIEPLLHELLSPGLEARALEVMTLIHLGEGRLHEAATLATRSSELGEAVGDGQFRQRLRLLRARIAHRAERHEEALGLLEPLLFELRRGLPSILLATVLSEVATLYDNLNRSEEALPLHYQALELAHQLNAPHHQVIATNHLVYCLLELGRPQAALAPGEAALALGHYRYSDLLRINLARAYLFLKRYEDAGRHYQHLCKHTSDPALCAAAWARRAEVYYHLNLSSKIKPALDRALKNLDGTNFGRAIATVAIVSLRYGTERQRKRLQPHLSRFDIEALPAYLKDELRPLLGHLERS